MFDWWLVAYTVTWSRICWIFHKMYLGNYYELICVFISFYLLFLLLINETIMWIICKRRFAAVRRLPSGRADQLWAASNPRPPRPNATTLTAALPPPSEKREPFAHDLFLSFYYWITRLEHPTQGYQVGTVVGNRVAWTGTLEVDAHQERPLNQCLMIESWLIPYRTEPKWENHQP